MSCYEEIDLYDQTRERPIPVRLWRPEGPARAWVVFSVGFGGERSGYAYLGRAWSTHGIATAVVEHIGSNLEVLKSLPGRTAQERQKEVARKVGDPQELAARPRDIHYVCSQLKDRFSGLPFGLAGHSYGTYTILAALGLPPVPVLPPVEPLQGAATVILMSPQPPGVLFSHRALRMLTVPALVVTGTKDALLDGTGDFRQRAACYDHLPTGLANLVVLEGAEHMAFANIGLGLASTLTAVEGFTNEWWESTLMGELEPAPVRARRLEEAAGQTVKGEYQ